MRWNFSEEIPILEVRRREEKNGKIQKACGGLPNHI
jgi:hypothetical protein